MPLLVLHTSSPSLIFPPIDAALSPFLSFLMDSSPSSTYSYFAFLSLFLSTYASSASLMVPVYLLMRISPLSSLFSRPTPERADAMSSSLLLFTNFMLSTAFSFIYSHFLFTHILPSPTLYLLMSCSHLLLSLLFPPLPLLTHPLPLPLALSLLIPCTPSQLTHILPSSHSLYLLMSYPHPFSVLFPRGSPSPPPLLTPALPFPPPASLAPVILHNTAQHHPEI